MAWTALNQDSFTGGADGKPKEGSGVELSWMETEYILAAGSYYLAEDINVDKEIRIANDGLGGTVNLCLDGHTLTSSHTGNARSVVVPSGSTLNLCDCKDSGKIIGGARFLLEMTSDAPSVNLYGGTLEHSGYESCVHVRGNLTLDGAVLKSSSYAINTAPNSSVTIKNGTVESSNTKQGQAYGVNVQTADFTMTGGEIKHTAAGDAAVYFVGGGGTISGGTITANGCGIQLATSSSVTLSGSPAIKGGKADIGVNYGAITVGAGLTGKYTVYKTNPSSITEPSPFPFTTASNADHSALFSPASTGMAGVGVRNGGEGNAQKVELYREHGYSSWWEYDADQHWKECPNPNCTAPKKDVANHEKVWKVGDTQHWEACSVCYWVSEKTDHTWAEAWSNNAYYHWHECTASGCAGLGRAFKDGYGAHVYDNDQDTTCNTCGYTRPVTPSHTHAWATTWTTSATHHWHECTAADCPVTENSGKDGYGAHVYDNDQDTTCNTCNYTRPVTPGHTHNYGDWQHNDTQHWKICSCGDETGRANHDFSDWVTDREATATEEGAKHRDCQTCSYRHEETIPATGTGTITSEVIPGDHAPATDISTPEEELKDMLLTEEEKQQVQNGTNIRIVLEVQDAGNTVSDWDRAAVSQALNGYAMGQYLNINLYKLVGTDRTDITETEKKIRIVITVPDSLKNTDNGKTRTYAVIRVHDGRAQLLADLDNSADTITIETDRFSTYAIAYNDKSGDDNSGNDNTGDGNTGDDNSGDDNTGNDNNGNGNGGNNNSGNNTGTADSGNNANHNGQEPAPGQEAVPTRDNEPKTGDAAPLELYATLAMIAGFTYLLLYFADRRRGMSEETKKELVSRIVTWAKQGGRLRKCLALAALLVLLVYYHSIGKQLSLPAGHSA